MHWWCSQVYYQTNSCMQYHQILIVQIDDNLSLYSMKYLCSEDVASVKVIWKRLVCKRVQGRIRWCLDSWATPWSLAFSTDTIVKILDGYRCQFNLSIFRGNGNLELCQLWFKLKLPQTIKNYFNQNSNSNFLKLFFFFKIINQLSSIYCSSHFKS
jgi:hypothetical protein